MSKIRVFISYSHQDKELVNRLEVYLEKECDVNVIWDKNLAAGSGFHDQIKDSIASAHIFMPLITKESSQRGWVHQEIGYAMALNIPVLPVTTENLKNSVMFVNDTKFDGYHTLAQLEHARWNAERLLSGWKLGIKKDVDKKISPYIKRWELIPEEIKKYDYQAVEKFSEMMREVGYEMDELRIFIS